jgi:eukaryotic-like serine/threonine-protein kinase
VRTGPPWISRLRAGAARYNLGRVSLVPGTRFGVFEVQSRLGVGGMGEVFRARDTRLGRDVALKVLSAAFATDRDRLERFTREARALAALNHPGIAAIYDTADVDGIRALVLELVDGVTLEERLRTGPIPAGEAIRIATAIAEALDAAHDRGMVHRDLKPANIKIAADGTVKLLDFGIARMLFDADGNDAATVVGAGSGVIVGTPAYMSPEQARGLALDKRADVWAFGCVLFEMLTGRAAFRGASWSDSIAQTLNSEPDWKALPSTTPSAVSNLLRRCLRKDPKERLRGFGGLELVLEQSDAPATGRRGYGVWLAAAAMAGLAVVAATLWVRLRPAAPPVLPPIQFEIPPTVSIAESGSFALSPDGTSIVFVGTGADRRFRMWERSLASLETTPISGTEGEVAANTTVFWSPDGQSIGFYSDGAVRRINRAGGTAQVVCHVPGVAVGGAWNSAGVIVVGNTAGGIVRCPASGGEPTPVTRGGSSGTATAPQGLHMFPRFLRDGQRLLYFRVSRGDPSGNGLYVADLRVSPDQQSTTRILETGFSAKYVAGARGDEYMLFVRNRNIWSVAFDSEQLATIGEPTQLASSVYTFRDGAAFDATDNVFVYRGGAPDYQMAWHDRSGKQVARVGDPGWYSGLALSPGATHAALPRQNTSNRNEQDLWVVDLGRNTTSRLTSDAFPESVPEWSADGQSVFYASGHDDADVRSRPLTGTAERTVISRVTLKQNMFVNPLLTTLSASRDGRWLTVTVDTRGANRSDIWILDLRDGGQLTPLIQQEFDQRQGVLSPDQRWLAYVSNESGADEVLLRPLTFRADAPPSAGAAITISRGGGRAPRWRGDSAELFYQQLGGEIVSVSMGSGTIGEPAPLFTAPGALAEWGVASDGKRFLLAVPTARGDLPFTVAVNWRKPAQ